MSAQVSFTPPPIQPALPLVCSKLASGPRAVAAHTRDWSSESFVQHSPGDAGGFAPNAWQAHALSYYRARYYSPMLGRFISEDPIGFLGGDVNLYAYVRNNPTNLIDPSGLDPCCTQNYGDCVRKCMEDRLGNLVNYAWTLYGLGAAFGIGSTPTTVSAGPFSATSNLATVTGGRLGRAIGNALGGASAGRIGLSIGVRVGAGTLAGIGLGASAASGYAIGSFIYCTTTCSSDNCAY
jgi:RHS repeat-associated protein